MSVSNATMARRYFTKAPSRERIPFSLRTGPYDRHQTFRMDFCFSFCSCTGRPQKWLQVSIPYGLGSHQPPGGQPWVGWVYRNIHSLFDANFLTDDVLFERARLGPRSSRTRHPSRPPQGQASQDTLGSRPVSLAVLKPRSLGHRAEARASTVLR